LPLLKFYFGYATEYSVHIDRFASILTMTNLDVKFKTLDND